MTDDFGATVNAWVNVVRRARLDKTTKLVALTLASYANPDGTKVFPGLARLVVQCRIGYGTARDALRVLRRAGLIELSRRGNRRRGQADEYRLILAEDLLERLDVPTPEMERDEIAKVAEQNSAADRARHNRSSPLVQSNGNEPITAAARTGLPLPPNHTPSIGPLHENQPPSDVRTELTVRAREPDQIPENLDEEKTEDRLGARRCGRRECRDGWLTLGINRVPCHICRPRRAAS